MSLSARKTSYLPPPPARLEKQTDLQSAGRFSCIYSLGISFSIFTTALCRVKLHEVDVNGVAGRGDVSSERPNGLLRVGRRRIYDDVTLVTAYLF